MTRPADMPAADRFEHGTRARYVCGCRCEACRGANAKRYRDRLARMHELAGEVTPTGPALPGEMLRGGRMVRIRRCPGGNGAACVRGGAWLRGQHSVCGACVERATVWDGRVPVERARQHLLALRAAGVGYKTVAAASDVATSTLGRVLANDGTIRASTERSILAVDAGALADGACVDAAEMNGQVASLRARGFTLRQLGRLLGYADDGVLQLGARPQARASTAARVARLAMHVERGDVAPESAYVDAERERAFLLELIGRGVTARWLSQHLGFTVTRSSTGRMRPDNARAVRALRQEVEQRRREGDGLPDDWQAPEGSGLRFSQGFGFDGGWLIRGRVQLATRKRARRKAA